MEFGPAEEASIRADMARLQGCNGDFARLDVARERKRQAWWEERGRFLSLPGSLPRQAYQLLIVHYLRLTPDEVPVVYEDNRSIIWRSYNFCPTLEACRRLGLDTRLVCKAGSEGSVQRLMVRLDPRLRFSRNYAAGLRPYAAFCEEGVVLLDNPALPEKP